MSLSTFLKNKLYLYMRLDSTTSSLVCTLFMHNRQSFKVQLVGYGNLFYVQQTTTPPPYDPLFIALTLKLVFVLLNFIAVQAN